MLIPKYDSPLLFTILYRTQQLLCHVPKECLIYEFMFNLIRIASQIYICALGISNDASIFM